MGDIVIISVALTRKELEEISKKRFGDMAFQHNDLAGGRWFLFSLAEQLGNIGSEVERAIKWHAKGNKEYFESAYARMLELLDLTIIDKRWSGPRRKELLRVREALCDSFEGGQQIGVALADWPKYFLPFAILARHHV